MFQRIKNDFHQWHLCFIRASICLIFSMGLACGENSVKRSSDDPDAEADRILDLMAPPAFVKYEDVSVKSSLTEDPYLLALLEQKEKTGRDNAQIYYIQALHNLPDLFNHDIQARITRTLKEGWGDYSQPLEPVLEGMKVVFEEINKGLALGKAENTGLDPAQVMVPMLEFRPLIIMVKMLCIAGKQYEVQNSYDKALDRYLMALSMSHDFIHPDSFVVINMIAYESEYHASQSMISLMKKNMLSFDQLKMLDDRLLKYETYQGNLADMLKVENDEMLRLTRNIRDEAKDISAQLESKFKKRHISREEIEEWMKTLPSETVNDIYFVIGYDHDAVVSLDDVERFPQRFIEENDIVNTFIVDYYKTAYSKRDLRGLSKSIGKVYPIEKMLHMRLFDSYDAIDAQIHMARAHLRAAMISVALTQYHLKQGRYPESLDPLAPNHIEAIPLDPFTDRNFDYHCDGNGKAYRLRSAGPDKVLTKDWAEYNRAMGPFSPGDLVY